MRARDRRTIDYSIMMISGRGRSTWAPERTKRIKKHRVKSEITMLDSFCTKARNNFGKQPVFWK